MTSYLTMQNLSIAAQYTTFMSSFVSHLPSSRTSYCRQRGATTAGRLSRLEQPDSVSNASKYLQLTRPSIAQHEAAVSSRASTEALVVPELARSFALPAFPRANKADIAAAPATVQVVFAVPYLS
ncbi:unnamed protein product [Protopolystoma xenopodis]|uniref:Uncharacterized protein n=1 Tax=Protopolystoma xenopodis TaxID=117903 RepID=A0A3S5FE42_9PLAT|nr:unnamed protein product [Protopolystoma xenopodis]